MKINTNKTEYIILGIIIMIGLVLRLYNYSSLSLSNDELSAIYRLNYKSFHDLISQGVGIDFHPAGVQIFLFYWVKIFGNSEASVRLPFVIAGTLAILFTYLFSRRWFGTAPALFSAAAITLLEFPLNYSQIARPYASGLMLSLLLAWLWSIVLFPKEKEKKHIWMYAIFLGIAFSLNLYNHYFSGLLAFIIGVSALVFINRDNIKPYILALIIGSALFIPHIPMTLHHMSKGGLSTWLGAPSWWWPIWHIETVFTSFFTLFIILIVTRYLRNKSVIANVNSKIRTLLLVFFLLPFGIGFFYSLFINPVLQNSVLIFSMPFIIVWVFSFIPSELNKNTLWSLLLISSTMIYSSYFDRWSKSPDNQNFKGIAQWLIDWNNNFPNQTKIWIMDSNSPDYIKYYLKEDTVNIKFSQWKIRDEQDLMQLKNILDTTIAEQLNYVVLSNPNNIAFYMIANKYPYVYSHLIHAPNSEAYLLSKVIHPGVENLLNIQDFPMARFSTYNDSIVNLKNITYSSGLEFYFTKSLIDSLGPVSLSVKTKMQISSSSNNSKSHLVFSISYQDGKESFWQSAPLRFFLRNGYQTPLFYQQYLPYIEEEAILKVYLWNPEQEDIKIRNLEIYLYEDKIMEPSFI